MKEENVIGTGYHYSKEFKDRFLAEWNGKYRFIFSEIVPDRSKVKSIFLKSMADIMVSEFPDEALKHNGEDMNKLIRNLYHCYIRWIETPTKELYEKYTISDSRVETNDLIVLDGNAIADEERTYTEINPQDDTEYNQIEVKECCECSKELRNYNITFRYGKPTCGIVFKWTTVAFDVSAIDETNAVAKAYELLWKKLGDITHTRIDEKSILIGGR